jgi:hypothetical protein
LLPEDETIELHMENQKEQREAVQKDKSSPRGLFQGHFVRPGRPEFSDYSIFDTEVCPVCLVDLDHASGRCPQCQSRPPDYAYSDPYMSDEDEDFSYPGYSEGDTMTDPEFDDQDDFDGIPPGYDEDWQGDYEDRDSIASPSLNITSPSIANFAYPGTILGYADVTASPRRSARSTSANRRYSSSILSDLTESQMDILEEEDEDEDSSMSGVADDILTTDADSEVQSMHSARSTPSSALTTQSSSSTTRRRRRADSNTPTPSMSQPSRRRRISVSSRQPTPYYATDLEQGPQSTEPNVDDEEESDGEVTSTGCEQTIESSNGSRAGGSLTPTVDQPHRTSHRTTRASSSRSTGARTLRSRGSAILMNSATHYEDNDADDDGSAPEDTRSVISIQSSSTVNRPLRRHRVASNLANHDSDEGGVELDSDDTEIAARRLNMSRPFNEGVRQALTSTRVGDENRPVEPMLEDLRLLNRTPVARPRTSNRNRSNIQHATLSSPSRQANVSASRSRLNLDPNVNQAFMATFHPSLVDDARFFGADVINRPNSRVSSINSPAANGRRASLNAANPRSPGYVARYNTWSSTTGNNPFRERTNQPSRTLREQPSNHTIRPSVSQTRLGNPSSRGNFRAAPTSPLQQRIPQHVQPEPIDQRRLPRALAPTPSLLHLPQSVIPPISASNMSRSHGHAYGMSQSAMDHEDRIQQRMDQARELVSRRANTWGNGALQDYPVSYNVGPAGTTAHGMNIARPSANPFSRGSIGQLSAPPPIMGPSYYGAQAGSGVAAASVASYAHAPAGGPSALLTTGQIGTINRRRSNRGLASSINSTGAGVGGPPASASATARTRTPHSVQVNTRAGIGSGRPSMNRAGYDSRDLVD